MLRALWAAAQDQSGGGVAEQDEKRKRGVRLKGGA